MSAATTIAIMLSMSCSLGVAHDRCALEVKMDMAILLTIACYFTASGMQLAFLLRKSIINNYGFYLVSLAALIGHGYYLHRWIDSSSGQNLSVFNMLSLVIWLVSILTVIISCVKPVKILSIFIFPLAAISMLLVIFFPGIQAFKTAMPIGELLHIITAIFAFSVLCLAGIQAILLKIQDRLLSQKRGVGLLQMLPPMETMEKILFQFIASGFMLLSAVLLSALFIFHDLLNREIVQKTILSCLAWGIFAILLWGRYRLGWYGQRGIRWTLWGVSLLLVAYFGTKLIG